MSMSDSFNRSAFGRFINSPAGRVFRLAAGTGFLVYGLLNRGTTAGRLALGWSVFPLTAGGFDVCYISAALGGPLSGKKIRHGLGPEQPAAADPGGREQVMHQIAQLLSQP